MSQWSEQQKEAEKKKQRMKQHFMIRHNLYFFAVFVLFSLLIVRLAYLQFVHGERFAEQESRTFVASYDIPPMRGGIYDATGHPLAYSVPRQSLFYRVEPGRSKQDVIEIAKALDRVFAEYGNSQDYINADDIISRMDVGYDLQGNPAKPPGYYYIARRIKTNVTKEEMAYILSRGDVWPGLDVVEESLRIYNKPVFAPHLIGYMRPFYVISNSPAKYLKDFYEPNAANYRPDENVGIDGIEFTYQDVLRGKTGSKQYVVDARYNVLGGLGVFAPEKGNYVHLTIHKDVQIAAERAIAEHLAFMRSNAARGTDFYKGGRHAKAGYAVAMEVDSGRIVAMANMPGYDPNVWQNGISTEQYNSIQYRYTNGAIQSRYADVPDIGRHPTSLVPPGSVIKPLTVLLGLNEGLIRPGTRYPDTGVFYFGKDNSKIYNAGKAPLGNIDAVSAIAHSSNTFMAMIGDRLYRSRKHKDPIAVWDDYMRKFGLGGLTGSGLPTEYPGDIYYLKNKNETAQSKLVFASFGQQGRYTTLQLAQFAATLASRGKRMRPMLVDRITDYSGNIIDKTKPEVLNEVRFPKQYWDIVERGMTRVKIKGFDDFKYMPHGFARKTGTSQQVVAGGRVVDNAVFIAYAPLRRPKLAVAVVVPEGGFGANGAAPIARRIFDAYDKAYGL